MNGERGMLGSNAVLAGTGVTYRQLDYWIRTGAIWPTESGTGSGSRRLWSRLDRERLRAIGGLTRDLRRLGLDLTVPFVFRVWSELDDPIVREATITQGAITITVSLDNHGEAR